MVLPVPVLALASTSTPVSATGQDCSWTTVMNSYRNTSASARLVLGSMLRSAHVSKEAYFIGKRDLVQSQKRSTIIGTPQVCKPRAGHLTQGRGGCARIWVSSAHVRLCADATVPRE
jgi:hypothetical protein